jgi:hypothetical protein
MIVPAYLSNANEQKQNLEFHHVGGMRTRRARLVSARFRLLPIGVLLAVVVFACVSCGGGGAAATTAAGGVPAPSSPPGSPPAPSAPPPTPSGVVLSHLEDSQWLTCGNCGNSNGGPAASYSWKRGIATPSEDGSSTEFSIASAQAFTNG